jgi:chromosome segregation ATPase
MRDIVSIATLKGFVTALGELALHEEKREASIAARVAGVVTQLSAVTEQRDQLMAELSSQRRASEKVQAQLTSLSNQLALVKRERDELRMVVKQVAADIPEETVALVMRLAAPDQVRQIVLNPNWLI